MRTFFVATLPEENPSKSVTNNGIRPLSRSLLPRETGSRYQNLPNLPRHAPYFTYMTWYTSNLPEATGVRLRLPNSHALLGSGRPCKTPLGLTVLIGSGLGSVSEILYGARKKQTDTRTNDGKYSTLTTAIGVGKNLLTYLLFGAVEYRTAIYVTLQGQQHGGSAVQWAGGVQLCVVVVNILSVY